MEISSSKSFISRPYTLFGRRKGKRLRAGKQELMQTLLPRVSVPEDQTPLAPRTLFSESTKEVWLEVGFGSGEHLAAQAKAHPETGFIGCEPFVNGIAGLLGHIADGNLKNIRIYPEDARYLLDRLPGGSLGRVFVLFPDPWPKKRHAERRFIGHENLEKLARVMKRGAELRIASDDPVLQNWIMEQLAAAPDFEMVSGPLKDRPADWPMTRYEEKALKAKRTPIYLVFRRVFRSRP